MGGNDYKETFGGDDYVHYLECGENFIDIHVSKLIKLYTLNKYILLLNGIRICHFGIRLI